MLFLSFGRVYSGFGQALLGSAAFRTSRWDGDTGPLQLELPDASMSDSVEEDE